MEHIKTGPKDFFLYLLSNLALYYCAGWLISLLYDIINYAFGSLNYYDLWLPTSMRWAVASLVIVFPLYVWVTHWLNQDLEQHAEKRELRVRKWLMYLTLSLASITLIVDMIALLNQFLSGEFATTFFLKVIAVALVAGMVFVYYWYELRRDHGKAAPARAIFRYSAAAIVLAAIVLGFVIVGSPTTARERQYDQQRISDLQYLQGQIVSYWQAKEQLPRTLNDLRDPISGVVPPVDPQAETLDRAYEYRPTGSNSFELCATFNQDGAAPGALYESRVIGGGNEVWAHEAGRTCFTRTIDAAFYPPAKTLYR